MSITKDTVLAYHHALSVRGFILTVCLFASAGALFPGGEAVAAPLTADIDLTPILFLQSQGDPRWAARFIGPKLDINMRDCGCKVALIATLLDFYAGRADSIPWFETELAPGTRVREFNPLYVNEWLFFAPRGYKQQPPGTCGTKIGPEALSTAAIPMVVELPGAFVFTPSGIVLDESIPTPGGLGANAKAQDLINDELRAGRPVMVRINNGQPSGHVQLIAGWDNDSSGRRGFTGYLIVDPMWRTGSRADLPGSFLAAYNAWETSVDEVLAWRPAIPPLGSVGNAAIWLLIGDDPAPIELLAISPDGRRTGFDPGTKSFLDELPSAVYYQTGGWIDPLGEIPPGDPEKFLSIRNPRDGVYRVQVVGTGDGPFVLSFSTFTSSLDGLGGTLTPLRTTTNFISRGQTRKYEVQLSSTAGNTVTEVPTFTPEARAGREVQGVVGVPIAFDGRQSVDYDGTIVGYLWDFGDGTTATGAQEAHAYAAAGTFPARLTVTDDQGATGTATVQASVLDPNVVASSTERVDVSSTGALAQVSGPGLGHEVVNAISADGRFIAFSTRSGNLVPGDTNGIRDIFVRDRSAGTTERVNVSTAGDQDDSPLDLDVLFSISADGRFVAFSSLGSLAPLPPGTPLTGGFAQVFVRDRLAGTTEFVSLSSDGTLGNGPSQHPSISADGRFVAFQSRASNLVPDDTNGVADIFVRDRLTGTTERVNVSSAGAQSNAPHDGPLPFQSTACGPCSSDMPTISADGRFVAFASSASNLVPGDTNGALDIFVRDRQAGTTERVNVSSAGAQDNVGGFGNVDLIFIGLAISADGRYVAFSSSGSSLVPGDTNGGTDVFVRDRLAGTTERVSVSATGAQADGPSGYPSISADGRFVAFHAYATQLTPDSDPLRTRSGGDVYVRDRLAGTTELLVPPRVPNFPALGDFPRISANGRFVTLTSLDFLAPPFIDSGFQHLFVRDRGFRPRPVADPSGRYLGWATSPGRPAFITFDASGSVDPAGHLLTARWDFGDGSPAVTASTATPVTHAYSVAGTYTATLTASNGQDTSDPATITVEVLPALAPPSTTVFPTCGDPGDALSIEVGRFPLVSREGGWNVGTQGAVPTVRTVADAVPAGQVSLIFTGPVGGVVTVPVDALGLPSALEFTARGTWVTSTNLVPGTYLIASVDETTPSASFTTPCPPPANFRPVADAGGPYAGVVGAAIRFDGSRSTDRDGDSLTYFWDFGDGATGTGVMPQHVYQAPGTYLATLVVNDGKEESIPGVIPAIERRSFAKVTATAVTNRPPVCAGAAPSVALLWPPDHRLVPVHISGVTDPDGDAPTIRASSVTQDEPVNGLGDGDTSPDAVIQGSQVLLRAERSGQGNGRVYTVRFTADDGHSGTCTGAVKVSVPHSMKPGASAIDDGQRYDSTLP